MHPNQASWTYQPCGAKQTKPHDYKSQYEPRYEPRNWEPECPCPDTWSPCKPKGPTFADFYALSPPDNSIDVLPGGSVAFPNNGPVSGDIRRTSNNGFKIKKSGTYMVTVSINTTEATQIMISLDDVPQHQTVFGKVTRTSPVNGTALLNITGSTTLRVINPSNSSNPLVFTPNSGGNNPVSAHLVIVKLN